MTKLFILHSASHGVFVGIGLGLAFFSADECAGQFEVPGAPTREIAQQQIDEMDLPKSEFADLKILEIETADKAFATIEELEACGLIPDEHIAPLRKERENFNNGN